MLFAQYSTLSHYGYVALFLIIFLVEIIRHYRTKNKTNRYCNAEPRQAAVTQSSDHKPKQKQEIMDLETTAEEASIDSFSVFFNIPKTEMVFVEGGTFTMGSNDSDAYDHERPTHQVTLSDYYIGKYEVTQQLWEYVMNYSGTCADGSAMNAYSGGTWLGSYNPSNYPEYGKGDSYPAYYVSYDDIVDIFLPRLNRITGGDYRLPTESEWEYAARGGKHSKQYNPKYSGSDYLDEVAWYDEDCSSGSTHQVGQKSPNKLGIHDMSGNVWEWCSDWYGRYSSSAQTNPTGPASGDYRVGRGGGWFDDAQLCRVSIRGCGYPEFRDGYLGFRLACRQVNLFCFVSNPLRSSKQPL